MENVKFSKRVASFAGGVAGMAIAMLIISLVPGASGISFKGVLVVGSILAGIGAVVGLAAAVLVNTGWFSGEGGEPVDEGGNDLLFRDEGVNVNGLPMFGGLDTSGNPFGVHSLD